MFQLSRLWSIPSGKHNQPVEATKEIKQMILRPARDDSAGGNDAHARLMSYANEEKALRRR